MNNYVCKIATVNEMVVKWNYEISRATNDKNNWIIWKKENIERFQKGLIIPYYGLLNDKIICECTAAINAKVVQNAQGLIDEKTAYLFAFRTIPEYQGQGYFSRLFKFMIADLKKRGYEKVTLGVEPQDTKNKEIYFKYGFNEHIKDGKEIYPNETIIDVQYYGKKL